MLNPEALFSNVYENDNSIFVTSCLLTKKWSEFLFDVFNWCTHELFEENYVTELDVNIYVLNVITHISFLNNVKPSGSFKFILAY